MVSGVYAALTCFATLGTGEHYVVDVIGGVILAAGAWWVMMRLVVPRVAVLRTARPILEATPAAVGTVGA